MPGGVDFGSHEGTYVGERRVEVHVSILVRYDRPLGVDALLGHRVGRVPHPVALDPKGRLESLRGDRLEIHRRVQRGDGVDVTASRRLELLKGVRRMPGPARYQVLHEVREPTKTVRLVGHSDP